MDKKTDKTYTLTEAYSEILKIKTEMVGKDYEEKNLNEAYKRGYHQAIKDMQKEFVKRSELLNSIFGFNTDALNCFRND